MGKNKRVNDNATMNNGAAAKKTSAAKWTNALLIAVAIILVASFVMIFIQSSGVLIRIPNAFKTENFEINGAMMQYLYKTEFNSFLMNYGSYLQYFPTLNINKSLRNQPFGKEGIQTMILGNFDGTWFDYFWNIAEAKARQTLIYCEAAKAKGVTLSDEDYKEIDDAINNLVETAKKAGYPSTNTYIYSMYGEAVKKSDIRDMLELSQLASKFYEQESKRIKDELTDEKVNKYFEDNKSKYYKADYISYTFTASLSKKGDKATPEEMKAYTEKIEALKKHANSIAAMKTKDEIEKYMITYWFDEYYDSYYTTSLDSAKKEKDDKGNPVITDKDIPIKEELEKKKEALKKVVYDAVVEEKKIEDLEASGKTAFDGVMDAVRDKLINQINKDIKALLKETAAFSDSNDEVNWIFAEDRKEGDTKVFNSDDKKKEDDKKEEDKKDAKAESETKKDEELKTPDDKFSTTVYFMVKPRYIQKDLVREFGHILITEKAFPDLKGDEALKAAEKEANRILEEFLKGDKTKEAFEAIANKKDDKDKTKNEDSNVFYEDVRPGDMVEEMNDWLFEEGRKAGDTKVIKTQYGYHVTYLVGFGKEIWFVDSKEDLYDDNLKKMYEDLEKSTKIDENKKVAARIEA